MPHELSRIDLLEELDDTALERIAATLDVKRYPIDAWVISVNDAAYDVYFMMSGNVKVALFDLAGRELVFRELGPGSSFGEVAALDQQYRSANAICLEESRLACLSQSEFRQILHDHPSVADKTMRKLCAQVRLLTERVYMLSAPVPKARLRHMLGKNVAGGTATD